MREFVRIARHFGKLVRFTRGVLLVLLVVLLACTALMLSTSASTR